MLYILEFPTVDLCTVAQIKIFGERIVLPASGTVDARFPPNTGCSVEINEVAGCIPSALLHRKMSIQTESLQLGKQ